MNTCVYQAVKVKVLYRNHKLCDSELQSNLFWGFTLINFVLVKLGGLGLVTVLLNVLLKMCHKSALGLTDMIYFFICNIA